MLAISQSGACWDMKWGPGKIVKKGPGHRQPANATHQIANNVHIANIMIESREFVARFGEKFWLIQRAIILYKKFES